jgi:hypothetical protein
LKIDETDFHIPTATTTTEQSFHSKPEKPVQTNGAAAEFAHPAEEGKSLAAVTTPLATFSYGLRRFYSRPKNWWSIALNDPSTAREAKQVGAAN